MGLFFRTVGGLSWIFVYVLAAQTFAGQAVPIFKTVRQNGKKELFEKFLEDLATLKGRRCLHTKEIIVECTFFSIFVLPIVVGMPVQYFNKSLQS